MKIAEKLSRLFRKHPFFKWALLNYLPVWGFILWLHFRLFSFFDPTDDVGYWIANFSSSTVYLLITYPLVKIGIFGLQWK